MDNRYYSAVIAEMKPFLDEQGFVSSEDGVFRNEKRAIKIDYDVSRQMYVLNMAEIAEGEQENFVEVTSWLFDDSQTESDAEAVGIDFTEVIRKNLGVKIKRSVSAAELPTLSKDGSYNITAFTKRVLDVFPQLKEPYKAHIEKYGNFLYLDFFGEYLIPQIKAVLAQNNKKSNKKLLDLLENGYINGDADTVNVIVALSAAACADDEAAQRQIFELLQNNVHFKAAVESFIPQLGAKSKLRKALMK